MKKSQANRTRKAAKKTGAKEFIHYYRDGTVWARGQTLNGSATGYWEWFRKDGTKMGSGYFENGQQVGEWINYDKAGKVEKVRNMKAK